MNILVFNFIYRWPWASAWILTPPPHGPKRSGYKLDMNSRILSFAELHQHHRMTPGLHEKMVWEILTEMNTKPSEDILYSPKHDFDLAARKLLSNTCPSGGGILFRRPTYTPDEPHLFAVHNLPLEVLPELVPELEDALKTEGILNFSSLEEFEMRHQHEPWAQSKRSPVPKGNLPIRPV